LNGPGVRLAGRDGDCEHLVEVCGAGAGSAGSHACR
jgi:hypothetical protein